MAQYDGSIRINTEINTSNLNSQTMRVNESLRRLEGEATRLRDRLRELETTEVPTEEYADLSNQLAKAQNRLDQLVQRQQRMQAEGRNSGAAWGRINRQIEVARNEVGAVETQMQELVDSGRAFRLGSDTDEYQRTSEQLRRVEADIEINNRRLQEMRNGQNSAADGFEEMEESSDKSLKNADSGLQRIIKSIKKFVGIIGTAFAVGKIIQFGKESLEVASDFEAMEAQFSQVFGELESTASESLSKVAGQAGIMEDRMKTSFTKIAAFAKTTGMNTADSLALSERAMMAVADSAAFYDRSLEETTEYLQSFLKGNYENDAALGLSATEYTRNAAAMKLYGKSFIDLSEAQKQLTLLQMVEDANRLSGAMGQAAREADTWTNQVGNLKQAWTTLMASIGKIILPVAIQAVKFITNVINSLNAMIERLSVAAGAFRSFSELLTGNKSSAGSGAGNIASSGSIGENTADGYNAAADAAENLAGSTEKSAKATKDAEKAAEGYLSPLDEINKINEKDSTSSSGGGGETPGIGGAVENVDYGSLAEGENAVDKLSDSLKALIDKFKELAGLFKKGFFEGLGDYKPRIEEIKKDIMSIGRTLKEIFTDPEVVSSANKFANQLAYSLGQVSGSIASIGITIAQNLIGGIEKYLTQNTERIKQYIISMFDIGTEISAIIGNFSVAFADIFSVFGGDTAQQITANLIGIFAETRMAISENAAKLGRDILNMIAQPIIKNKDIIKNAVEGTLQAIEPFTSGLLTAAQTIRDAVSDVYDNHLKPLFDSIANGASEILGKLLDGYNTYMVPVLEGLGQKFQELMEGPFGEALEKISGFIGKIIDAMRFWQEGVLVPLFGWIAANVVPVLALVAEYMGTKLLNVIELVINEIGDTAEILGGLVEFIVGVFTGDWETAWSGIEQIFSGVWNLIVDAFTGVKEAIGESWEIIKEKSEEISEAIRSKIQSKWDEIKQNTEEKWGNIKEKIKSTWENMKTDASSGAESIKSKVKDKWEGIKSSTASNWDNIKSKLYDTWDRLKSKSSAFSDMKSNISSAWESIKRTTESIWGSIARVIRDPINSIISSLNGLISRMASAVNGIADMLNSLSFDIPDWLGGGSLSLNLPKWTPRKIPYLATGTVVPPNREFMAVLGDNKREPEVVSPLSTIEQAMENVMARHGGSGSGGNGNVTLQVILDRKVLAESTLTWGEIQQMSTGKNPFMLGTT